MNDKDKEAFEKWWQQLYDNHVEFRDWQGCDLATDGKEDMRYGWQAACEYKQKEIDDLNKYVEFQANVMCDMGEIILENKKLQSENSKLRECVEFYAKTETWDADGWVVNSDIYAPWDKFGVMVGGKRARQVLKELEDK